MKAISDSTSNNGKVISVEALFKHGIETFGTEEKFMKWLKSKNFFFDKKAPIEFLNTPERIEYVDNRLTGLEYGDNA